jgi:hypothetical protein
MTRSMVVAMVVGLLLAFSVTVQAQGPPLVPAGNGGYVNPQDGTSYVPSGGGITNTRTGELMPSVGGSGFSKSGSGEFVPAVPDPNKNKKHSR